MTDDDLVAAGWKLRPFDGFVGTLGPLWSRREGAGFAYALRAEPRHANALGVIHGGLLSTLVDHAMLVNAWESAGRRPCVTASLDVRFVAASRPGDLLVATAHVDDQGTVLMFASGLVGVAGPDSAIATVVRASAVIRVRSGPS